MANKNDNAFMRVVKYLIPWEGDKPSEKIRKLIFIAAAVVLVVTVSILIANGVHSANDKKQNDSLASIYNSGNSTSDTSTSSSTSSTSSTTSTSSTSTTSTSSTSTDPYAEKDVPNVVQSSFDELLALNPDTVGWLSIDDVVNLPVMQTTDNDYYLTHDFNGNASAMGALYVDYHNKVTAGGKPDNTVIYGHNDAGAEYFGGLPNYFNYSITTGDPDNISFYKAHPTITYNTIYKNSTYKIFAGMLANVYEEDGEVFPYHTVRTFGSKADFDNYVANILDRSNFYNTDVDVQYGDKLLTLSTCMWGYGTPSISASRDAHLRWVIFAREVREGEDASVDVSKAYANPDPLFFDAYYNNYAGGSWGGRKWPKELLKDYANY
ncbi:MAG: class B sortase [Ruminococcaceae bacterium]|nr:class B sortase [Oscillospiraceae bacterium]